MEYVQKKTTRRNQRSSVELLMEVFGKGNDHFKKASLLKSQGVFIPNQRLRKVLSKDKMFLLLFKVVIDVMEVLTSRQS